MMDDHRLDELFSKYRQACPDRDPSVDFMPNLWARIEGKRSFTFVFQRLARMLVTASAGACLLLAALNLLPHSGAYSFRNGYATYTDALSAETTVERTYYSGAIPSPANVPLDYPE
jgi:hypothetical protein